MKLYKNYGLYNQEVLDLPNDLLWVDEFSWSPVVQHKQYSLTGAMIVESAAKQTGRPITLEPPQDMAWVGRNTATTLWEWAALPGEMFTLKLEYASDTRQFTVIFDQENTPVEASPVKGFPQHASEDFFIVKLRLTEV